MKWGSLPISGAFCSNKANEWTRDADLTNGLPVRLGPACTVETRPGSLLLQLRVYWSSAPCPTQPVSDRHTEVPPPAACVTSLQVQPRCSPRPHRLDLVFLHRIRTTRAERTAEATFKRQDLPPLLGLSPDRNEAGISSYHLIFDRSSIFVCVCVGWSQPGILQIGKPLAHFR